MLARSECGCWGFSGRDLINISGHTHTRPNPQVPKKHFISFAGRMRILSRRKTFLYYTCGRGLQAGSGSRWLIQQEDAGKGRNCRGHHKFSKEKAKKAKNKRFFVGVAWPPPFFSTKLHKSQSAPFPKLFFSESAEAFNHLGGEQSFLHARLLFRFPKLSFLPGLNVSTPLLLLKSKFWRRSGVPLPR